MKRYYNRGQGGTASISTQEGDGGVETAAENETPLNQITVNKTKEAKVKTKHQDYKLSK